MGNEKDAKLKALQLTLDKLDKAYGKGTVMRMNDEAQEEIEAISSWCLYHQELRLVCDVNFNKISDLIMFFRKYHNLAGDGQVVLSKLFYVRI